ncbi:MAG: Hint domain-containing homing endonuclease [Candidatus Thorarchaeota archaeon]
MTKRFTIHVSANEAQVEQPLPFRVIREINKLTSYELPGAWVSGHGPQRAYLFRKQTQKFPSGLLKRVKKAIRRMGYKTRTKDYRAEVKIDEKKVLSIFDNLEYNPRYYQADGIIEGIRYPYGLFWWPTGCHAKGTKIIMYDGSLKAVEDVRPGDKLLGPDSKPRTVLSLARGFDDLYEINPLKGEKFIVNKDHMLSLVRTNEGGRWSKFAGDIENISVEDYLGKSDWYKHTRKLYRSGLVKFSGSSKLPLDPYVLGILLGDGCFRQSTIGVSTADKEIVDELNKKIKKFGLELKQRGKYDYGLSSGIKKKKNLVKEIIKELGLLGCDSSNKFIPDIYKRTHVKYRYELLAGLIDSDGSTEEDKHQAEITSKSFTLASDIQFLCRSLGLMAQINEKTINTGEYKGNVYFRVTISGDLENINSRLKRKKITRKRIAKKNVNRTSFLTKYLGEGIYYGFQLSGDHLYMTDDFIVHHNSGKTFLFSMLLLCYNVPSLILTHRKELLYQIRDAVEDMTGKSCGIIGDGQWSPKKWTVGIVNSFMQRDNLIKEVSSYLESIEYLIIDEAHHLGAKSWWKIAKKCKNTHARHGFSGTCFRTDNADLLLLAHTGDVISHYTTTYMIEEGWLSRPHIYRDVTIEKISSHSDWHTVENELIMNNKMRNRAGSQFIYDQAGEGKQVLVMVRRVPHGRILKQMLIGEFGVEPRDIRYMTGSEGTDTRKRALLDYKYGTFPILIGTSIYDEGIDLPTIGAAANMGGGKSDIKTTQKLGRAIRKIVPDGEMDVDPEIEQTVNYYDPFDKGHRFVKKHSNTRQEVYEGEEAFVLKGAYNDKKISKT